MSYTNRFTGEVLPFKSPYSVQPDKGIENTKEDQCVLSDYESIGDMVARFQKNPVLMADLVNKSDQGYEEDVEKNQGTLDEVNASDFVDTDDDPLESQLDLMDYADSVATAGAVAGDSPTAKESNTTESISRASESEDATSEDKRSANEEKASDA